MTEENKSGDQIQTGQNAPDSGNVFTKLFGAQKSLEASKPVEQAAALKLSNGAASSQKPVSIASLLGPKPEQKDFEALEAKRTKLAKGLLGFAVFAVIAVYAFFSSQLNADFTYLNDQLGPNVASLFASTNSTLEARQTAINVIKYRMANLWLNDVSFNIDAYKHAMATLNSDTAAMLEKQTAQSQLTVLEASVKESLKNMQDILSQDLGVDTYTLQPVTREQREERYFGLLRESFAKERAVAAGDSKPNRDAIRAVDDVIRLVDNKRFIAMIKNKNFSDMTREELESFLDEIREQGTDELSSVNRIRQGRLDWGRVIRDIHAVIMRKADPLYGQGLFRTVGGFMFNAYRFDAATGRITISGTTKRSDGRIFSVITDLIDSIEKSNKFKDIDFRSFAKSRDERGDYSSAINLEFSLQEGNDPRDGEIQADADLPTSGTSTLLVGTSTVIQGTSTGQNSQGASGASGTSTLTQR